MNNLWKNAILRYNFFVRSKFMKFTRVIKMQQFCFAAYFAIRLMKLLNQSCFLLVKIAFDGKFNKMRDKVFFGLEKDF
jgi:hypothetical protein